MRRVRPLGRAARREWGPLWTTVRAALAANRLRAVPMTLAAVCLTALLQVAQNRSWGYGPVQALGAVRAEDPLPAALLRTPLSLFVPALDLPVWGALAQVLLVFGIAEICLGRWRTLLIAYVATLAGTLYARIGVAAGPDGFLGLPGSDAQVVDTGPSAAVVALAVCVCCAYRARFTGGLVIVAMVAEIAVKNNLAGKEHLAAIAAALVLCAVPALRRRSRQGLGAGAGTLSGAPPIRSWNLRRGPAQRTSWW
ncbi:hypothetical protein [Streptomyces sp. NBC_00385]|uniref:hypothetical protein n=1 Tax=Streptomyces sp. NBC_00385 TaxID=2975733 RepID=UPI002DDC1DA9|nr:hypothetical protein [Streptomyces sp. NBC_00385]WRZ07041.1 hypothetical protein OG959_28725 [Streptomyces sp. NBC_00385]